MSGDKLTPLQHRILETLAILKPPLTLTGGAALAGLYLKHRPTRDLDLFWHGRDRLGSIPSQAQKELAAKGFEVRVLQTGSTFHRIRVSDGSDVCMVDIWWLRPYPRLRFRCRARSGRSQFW